MSINDVIISCYLLFLSEGCVGGSKDEARHHFQLPTSFFTTRPLNFYILNISLDLNCFLVMASTKEAASDAFTFIDRSIDIGNDGDKGPPQLFPKYGDLTSAKLASPVVQLIEDLRVKYPEYVVSYVDVGSLNLLSFAFAGHATATLDIETESVFRMRAWQQPSRRGEIGQLAEGRGFAKYRYRWGDEHFILYCLVVGFSSVQFVLKECGPGESQLSHSAVTDTLLAQVGLWQHRERPGIYVYDFAWRLDQALYDQVQKFVSSAEPTSFD